MNKDLIKQRFGKKLGTYNENAKVQKQMCEKLLSYIPKDRKYGNILEIGCGTGLLTKLAIDNLEYNSYIANDIVPTCEEYIKKINPKIEFIPKDIEEFIQSTEKKFDLIISNASLQWIENFDRFIGILIEKLNKGGLLVFSTFGKENFREIFFVIGKTLQYYSAGELKEKFSNYQHTIEEEIRILAFKTPKDVLKHIQKTGVNAIASESWTKKDLSEFETGYNNFCSGKPTLTYNPIYIKILSK